MVRPHVLVVLAGLATACSSTRQPSADAGTAAEGDVARAEAILRAPELPARPELIAIEASVEAQALREGAGARSVTLHVTAARLLERSWRLEHREEDAKQALEIYRLASLHLETPGACDAALRLALLSGEIARDAGRTYAELYRVERRSAPRDAGSVLCPEVSSQMGLLEAFRPPPSVLAAIDQGLQGEGDVLAGMDASVRVSTTPKIVRVEQWSGEEGARVVVTLDRPARFRAGDEASAGGKGARTFVELDGTDIGTLARDVPMGGVVTRAKVEGTVSGARVVLELGGPAYRKVFHLLEPFRVVIDIARNPPGMLPKGKRAVNRIVLDPGHGGTDPGAIGPAGAKEKDVTLDIAHRAAPVLAKFGMQVTLTRDDDRLVSLEERTARANSFGADLFVSIHCNASENHARHGVETYVLDTTTSDIANRVAARENATSQAANAELGSILANMRLADQASRSTKLAELLQKSALASLHARYPDVTDGGVHTAGFYVLVGARMPGVLFETSYISNPKEEARLVSPEYKDALVDAIVNAIRAYREGR